MVLGLTWSPLQIKAFNMASIDNSVFELLLILILFGSNYTQGSSIYFT